MSLRKHQHKTMNRVASLSSQTDEQLMSDFIQSRSELVFECLYNRHWNGLSKYLYWIGNEEEASKDIAQLTFMKVFESPQNFDIRQNFKVWLFVVAKNLWINEVRKRNTRKKYEEDNRWESPAFQSDSSVQTDDFKNIQMALKELSEDHKEVFVLKYSNNLTIPEISEVLGCKPGTVKSRLFYAMQQLRKSLSNQKTVKS